MSILNDGTPTVLQIRNHRVGNIVCVKSGKDKKQSFLGDWLAI